jgi:hypothetical protein
MGANSRARDDQHGSEARYFYDIVEANSALVDDFDQSLHRAFERI